MGEARRRKLAWNTEPKTKRKKKIPRRKMVGTDPAMALLQALALLMHRRR